MKKIILLLCLGWIFTINAQEQQYTYAFSVATENYEDLSNTTSVNSGEYWDDEDVFMVPIGFDFQLADKTISTLYIHANSGVSTENDDSENVGTLTMFFADIKDRGNENDSQSPISYKTEGDPESRIFKLEWKNVGFWDGSSEDFVNIQLWLYEGSNKIEFHYGSSNIVNAANAFDGNNGPSIFLIPSQNSTVSGLSLNTPAYLVNGDSTNPTVTEVFPGEEGNVEGQPYLNNMIPEGMVYIFTPSDYLSIKKYNNFKISIFPNPVEDKINILSHSNSPFSVSIYNNLGQLVKVTTTDSHLEVKNLAPGFYFMKIKNSNISVTKKFIKK